MDYTLIRSKRKTLALEVKPDLTVIVRAPKGVSQTQIDAFLEQHQEWLKTALERTRKRKEFNDRNSSPQREAELKQIAAETLPRRTAEWANIMDVSPEGVTITSAKTRFGSCSGKNRICYSWRLMAYPPDAVDYVIVHELAHIRHKNHSPRFYQEVETYLPDWKRRRELLK